MQCWVLELPVIPVRIPWAPICPSTEAVPCEQHQFCTRKRWTGAEDTQMIKAKLQNVFGLQSVFGLGSLAHSVQVTSVVLEWASSPSRGQLQNNMSCRKHLLPQLWAPKPETLLPGSNLEELYQQVWNECKCAASLDLIAEEHLFIFHFSTTVNPHLLGSLQPAKIACCWVILKRISHHSPGSCCCLYSATRQSHPIKTTTVDVSISESCNWAPHHNL